MSIWYKIFLGAIVIAFLDSLDEVLFGGNGFLGDFSLLTTIIAIVYIIGSLILWIALFLESIVLGDFLTPFTTLLDIAMMFVGIVGQSIVDFLFNIMKFPFQFIANFANELGIDTRYWFGVDFLIVGGVVGLDLESMTFFLGFRADIGLVQVQVGSTLSILGNIGDLGGGNNLHLDFDFVESGALGFATRVRATLGGTMDQSLTLSLQLMIEEIFKLIKFYSDPQAVFDRILEQLRELGKQIVEEYS